MTATDLLSAVLADPNSDARNGLADHWAENPHLIPTLGLPAGVEVVWRDGIPDEIRCTMAQWVGGKECYRCQGYSVYQLHEDVGGPMRCIPCKGTGRTPGIAKQVCEQWPVTVVRLTGAEALRGSMFVNGQLRRWVQWSHEVVDSLGMTNSNYHTEQEALAALSHAALNYGRRLAGLPEIQLNNMVTV